MKIASSVRPQVLFLAHRLPYPPDKGDRIRTFHVLQFLARRYEVSLACLADEAVPADTLDALNRLCARVAIIPVQRWPRRLRALASLVRGRTATEGAFHEPALQALLQEWAREYHFQAALATASSMIPYLRSAAFADVPVIIDLIDVDSQKWFDYAESSWGPRSWFYGMEGRRLRSLEQNLPSWARAATLVSEAEAELFRSICPWKQIHAISNGVDLHYFQPSANAEESGCVFTGALDYKPNVDGIIWFCQAVWPEIHRQRPDCRLAVVGRKPVPAVLRLGSLPGVDVIGQVPDVRPYLARAAVAVIPLRIARGIQNKVLEALAMGKAVVASPSSLEGLHLQPGVEALAASTPQEWQESVLKLLANSGLRRQLGTAGRAYAEKQHNWEACLRPFEDLLSSPLA